MNTTVRAVKEFINARLEDASRSLLDEPAFLTHADRQEEISQKYRRKLMEIFPEDEHDAINSFFSSDDLSEYMREQKCWLMGFSDCMRIVMQALMQSDLQISKLHD